jgi:arylsulfatase A-like enzyme
VNTKWPVLAIALVVLIHAPIGRAQTSAPKFNVLFIMSDDMRAECGCYGGMAITPNIDALAKSGVLFQRAYCQFPLCNPSRSSMLTGRHPTSTGVLGNRQAFRQLHPDWISLPQLFKENGYVSLRNGKIFHGGIDDPKAWTEVGVAEGQGGAGGHNLVVERGPVPPQPADVPPPFPGDVAQAPNSDRIVVLDGDGEGNPDFAVAARTIEFMRQHKDEPFFIGCGFSKPHSPPAAPQRFFDLYDLKKIDLTPDFAAWPTVWPGFPKGSIRMLNADLFIGRGAGDNEAKEVTRAYLASCSWVDWNVGRVLAELDKLGLREKTIVLFWGDHGYQLGEKGKWSKAGSLWEQGAHVPFIMHVPGARGNGKATNRIVQDVDFYPTLAELCGLPKPGGLEGRSLVPLLNDPQAEWNHPAFTSWSEDGRTLHGVSVRTDKWRYAEFGPGGSGGAMLTDPVADRYEVKNVADDPQYASVRAELSGLVRNYAANLGKTQTTP